jgi:hypothetical protein
MAHTTDVLVETRLVKLSPIRATASLLSAAFLFAIALGAAPQLHAWLHPDSSSPDHQCAATLIASGNYEHSVLPAVSAPPQPAPQFVAIPTLKAVSVPALFLGASIFEHAPPALS